MTQKSPDTASEDPSLCRARLAYIQRIGCLGNWEWQPETGVFWWSAEIYRILGLTPERTPPSYASFLSVLHPDDRESFETALRQTRQQGTLLNVEFRIFSEGNPRFVRSQGEMAVLIPGRPPVIFGTLQDITEQKETENRLRLLKEAVECLPIGITITGIDGKILYTNPAEAQIHGYTVDELLSLEARKLAPPRLSTPVPLENPENIGVWRRETTNVRKTGEEFPVQLSSIAVRNAQGAFLGMITACEDISERKASEQRIVELAYTDTLTSLPNRWMFQDRLNHALAEAGRNGNRVGVMFLDLDQFKDVNDTLGHEFGDHLLRAVAQRLTASTRGADTLARLGGDEFVVIMTNVSLEGMAVAAQRILAAFRMPFDLEGRKIYSGASIGIAVFPEDGNDVPSLLQSADMAMYHAKGKGRKTYQFFSREMNRSIRRKVALENGLRRALEGDEFHLAYQAQWDLSTSELVGLEALIRWDCPEFGGVRPDSFIPLAESAGLIHPLGEWVLRSACTQAAAWLAEGWSMPRVSVNISGHQLKRPDFLDMVDAVLRETGLAPQRLEFEFTESALMEEADHAATLLRALKERGIHLSIDDFGTGYSSLSQLRHFPIDRIKIDRSFVADLSGNSEGETIVEAVIAMGRSLKLKVMAEGVENRRQLDFLHARGCDEAQGFFFAKPLTAKGVEILLAPNRAKLPPALFSDMPDCELGSPS